jgi:N-acetyl-1-D-myo-inositol-2-amino-2-deoxy-alpha-D-glucopyranoside deacetylase
MSDFTPPSGEAERVLFVHAHPDDESITTGGTIATLVARGAAVTVLTCTRGELGEVIPDELQYLLASPESLGAYREGELAAAMRALGVSDHRYLGDADARWVDLEPRRYRDSGMRWGASGTAEALDETDERSLSAAPVSAVTADIAAVIADIDATAVVSYDARGGYGHPDHVRAHDSASRAAEVMGVPFFEIATDARGPIAVDVAPVAAQKRAALAAYRTQLTLRGDELVLSNGVPQPIGVTETFRRAAPDVAPDSVPFREQTVGVKIGIALLVLAFGAIIGALMTAVHQSNVPVGDLSAPWGLALALIASTGFVVGLRVLTGSRILPILATVGIMGATAYLASPTVGGSVIVPANIWGVIWTFAPAVVILVTVAWPNLHRARPGTADVQHGRG